MSVADNVLRVREQIAEAALKSGRSPGEIILVGASKTKPAELVREAIEAGIDAIGENRVQEMLQKSQQGAYDGAPLHFIGHLQSNKIKDVVGLCDMIESVSSLSLLRLISERAERAGIRQDVLLEVNIGAEESKSGIGHGELGAVIDEAGKLGGVTVKGLMAIPPVYDVKTENYRFFDAMQKLFVDMSAKKYDNVSMQFLSMGMSDSFVDAICAGSNMVRVGFAVFGERDK